jgi:hypothetical protein
MNFTEQPSSIVGANSPLIYQAYDGNYAVANFNYLFNVYVWSGTTTLPATPVATIKRLPDQFGGGRGWIDIHKIVTQYIKRDYFLTGTYKPNIGEGAMRVVVTCQGYLGDIVNTAKITSNTILATQGYTYTQDGFNVGYGAKYVYTDKSQVTLTSQTPQAYLWYDASVITSITCGSATVTPNTITTSSQLIQGIEIKQLMTAGGVWGVNANITFVKTGDDVVMPVVFDCQNKYGQQDALYLNKYGVYDSYLFNALSRDNYGIEKETYSQPIFKQASLGQDWSYGVGITTSYLVNSKLTMMVNTDWIGEADIDAIEQVFYSNNILMLDGNIVLAARVVDTAMEKKKQINENLIQYTIQFEYSQPKINKIVR